MAAQFWCGVILEAVLSKKQLPCGLGSAVSQMKKRFWQKQLIGHGTGGQCPPYILLFRCEDR